MKGWWDAQTKTLSYISFLHKQMCRSTIYAWASVYTLTCRTLELCDVLVADTSHIQCRHVLPHRGSVAVQSLQTLLYVNKINLEVDLQMCLSWRGWENCVLYISHSIIAHDHWSSLLPLEHQSWGSLNPMPALIFNWIVFTNLLNMARVSQSTSHLSKYSLTCSMTC